MEAFEEPVPKTIMDMPVHLMQKITEDLNPFEKCYLRSVNHEFKNFIDSIPTVFEGIWVTADNNKLSWKLNGKEFECEKEDDGCTLSKRNFLNIQRRNNRVTKTYKECYVKKKSGVPEAIIQNRQTSNESTLVCVGDLHAELDELLPVSIHASRAYFVAYDFDKTVQILSTIKAGHLESFSIEFEEPMGKEHFTRVFETDQFKQAQIVEIHCIVEFNLEDLVNFEHLKQFICGVRSLVEPEEILQIRDHNNVTDSSASTTHHHVNPNFKFYGSTQAILTAVWLGSLLCQWVLFF
ncbi:hypothetical protein B9Z55_023108 [Caenorhabditis nigoni]|uniref:F-box domain-containing protein n=1 Tax=Caenorhabditis nigoni TaxID=1611254 RepID=A0A2G5SNK2_9PELO|nr:hypothetical protein B9Z55_023108 [Caenorhabditis nigoni]